MTRIMTGSVMALWLSAVGCVVVSEPGPTLTETKDIEAGEVEAVRAEIRMGAGELRLEGGSDKLLEAKFRYSENLGKPEVRYDHTGFRGQLTIESSKKTVSGNVTNEWNLKMGAKTPLDLSVHVGAGDSRLDLSQLQLKTVDMHIGAGRIEMNLAGKYTRDVQVDVKGGVGQAVIKLPKDVGVIAEATGGIGSVDVHNLEKRDGKYYNAAYKDGKPAIHLNVKGGVGEIQLNVVD